MKFRYKKYGSGILRPVIPIEIIYKDIAVPYEVLVDSGADYNKTQIRNRAVPCLKVTSAAPRIPGREP